MSGPNHVAGGIVFTGLFASLWNINVFGTLDLFMWTGFAAMLPDIDHTKSILGKMFYPVSRWVDRNWGHRTITHSLIFLALITLLSSSIERIFSDNYHYTTVLFFAVFSHLIIDMLTVQGVPLFYPFAKNPCVIPGNPTYRIRSNDRRAEAVAFAIFILIGVSCINLFQNGFWTSYNRAFGTITHVHRENKESNNILLVDYNFTKNEQKQKGTGFLISSTENKIVLLDKEIITLDKKDNSLMIHSVKPRATDTRKHIKEIGFFNIDADSLLNLTRDKVITGQIQSSDPVEIIENNITKKKSLFKLEHAYNFNINIIPDSTKKDLKSKIRIKELRLAREKQKYQQKKRQIKTLKKQLQQYQIKAQQTNSIYLKNKYQDAIIDIRKEVKTSIKKLSSYTPDPIITYEIRILKQNLNKKSLLFSGMIKYPVLPVSKPSLVSKH